MGLVRFQLGRFISNRTSYVKLNVLSQVGRLISDKLSNLKKTCLMLIRTRLIFPNRHLFSSLSVCRASMLDPYGVRRLGNNLAAVHPICFDWYQALDSFFARTLCTTEHKDLPVPEDVGIAQGTFLKRHRVPKAGSSGPGAADYVGWEDLQVGLKFNVYGRSMQIVNCDAFTRDFFATKGMPQGAAQVCRVFHVRFFLVISSSDFVSPLSNCSLGWVWIYSREYLGECVCMTECKQISMHEHIFQNTYVHSFKYTCVLTCHPVYNFYFRTNTYSQRFVIYIYNMFKYIYPQAWYDIYIYIHIFPCVHVWIRCTNDWYTLTHKHKNISRVYKYGSAMHDGCIYSSDDSKRPLFHAT